MRGLNRSPATMTMLMESHCQDTALHSRAKLLQHRQEHASCCQRRAASAQSRQPQQASTLLSLWRTS